MARDPMSPHDLPEGWEAWLAYFSAALPQPVEQTSLPDGTVVFQAGDPREVIVHLMPRTVIVSLYTVQWAGLGEPIVVARPVGRLMWRRLPIEAATTAVEAVIDAARTARRATFRTCESCEVTKPPEEMQDERMCRRCAGRDVVH